MADDHELTGADAAEWERRLRNAEESTRVLSASDVDLSVSDFHIDHVHLYNGRVTVSLMNGSDEDYVALQGTFDAESEDLQEVTVDDGYASHPLAGHGDTWTYKDGEVRKGRWIS